MNSKWHFVVSNIKSTVRIIGCIIAILTKSIGLFATFFLIAEVLGILEELGDKR